MTPESLATTLTIIRNSSAPLEVFLTGDDDEFVNISSFSAARFRMMDMLGSAGTEVLTRDGAAATIDTNKVVLDAVSSAEWDNIPEGLYVADVAVQNGSDWFYSEIFYVEVVESVTELP